MNAFEPTGPHNPDTADYESSKPYFADWKFKRSSKLKRHIPKPDNILAMVRRTVRQFDDVIPHYIVALDLE